jgi:nitrogen fixation negative regulator NifL
VEQNLKQAYVLQKLYKPKHARFALMPELKEKSASVSTQALTSLMESYLHAPSPALAKTLRSVLAEWELEQVQPLPPHILEKAVEQSPVAISITDLKANILYANACFTEVTGYLPDEIVGKNESMLSYKSTPPEVYQELWHTLMAKQRWSGMLVNKRKDGSRYLAEVCITPVLDAAGAPTHYLGIHRDITAVFALEQQVKNQKALIESVVDSTPSVVAVIDAEKKVVLDNQAYKKLVGDLRGKEAARELLEGMCKDEPAFAAALEKRESFQGREVPLYVSGREDPRWFLVSGIWFREQAATADAFFSGEKVTYLLLVAQEITAQKQQQELIRRNAMRALMAEDELTQEVRETLAAAVYQLESPFNMLNAALEMLQRREANNAMDGTLLAVLSEVREQGLKTLGNLRNAIPNAIEQEPASINFNRIVHDVLLVSTERLLTAGIVIDWQPLAILPPLNGWEPKLRSMVKQLLDNAIDAISESDSGRRDILLKTSAEDGWVCFSICDSGQGIPEALRLKVFEPFFSTRAPGRVRHTGMGLSLAQEVVNQHSGTIEIDPDFNDGCCVQVRFPAETH